MTCNFVIRFWDWITLRKYSTILSITTSLQPDDAPTLPNHCNSQLNGGLLRKHWRSHFKTDKPLTWSDYIQYLASIFLLNAYDDQEPSKSLTWALLVIYGRDVLLLGVVLCTFSILSFSGPALLHALVSCAENDSSWGDILWLLFALIVSKLLIAILSTQYTYYLTQLSITMGAGLKDCLFTKTLRLSTESRREFTTGNIANLYMVDIERIEQGLLAINNLWVLPIQIAISMVLLFNEVSYAMFAGLVSISLILILNHYISIVQKSATDDTMIWKDKRMKLSSEVFNSILNIKFNAWEDNFLQKILDLRLEELKHVWRFLFIAAINVYLLWMAPYVVSVSTITFYTRILHYDVSAAKIFTALALFRMLQDPLRQLPNCITQLYQAISSIERLDKFYQAREKVLIDSILQLPCGAISIPESNFEWYETMDLVQGGEKQIIPKFVDASHTSKWWNILNKGLNSSKQRYSKVLDDSTHDVEEQDKVELRVLSSNSERSAIEDNSLSKTDSSIQSPLGHSRFILRLPQYKIQPGDLVFIKGKIGSGKSSFLSAILGEMYASNYPATIYPSSSNIYSSIKILGSNSSVSYASQQAWIQHMTVKENILFESAYNETRYQRVVDACALIDDFLELPNYDETMIGEKGLNLSGGQKARIALARAVYANSDIILLDDVLAALDPKVGNKVFQKCILELLRGKTRLIVSHNEELWKHQGINVLITFGSDEEQVHIARHSSASDKPAISSPTAFSKSVSIDDVEYIMSSKYLPRQCIPGYFDSETVGNIDLSTGPRDLSYKKNYSFVGNHSDHDSSISEMLYSKSKNKSDNRQTMTYEEDRSYGAVNSQVYKSYIDAMGGWRIVGFLCIVQSVWQCLSVSSDIYLSHWSKENDVQQERYLDQNLVIYSVLTLGSGLVVLVRTMTVSTAGYYAAKSLFERMLGSLINAPSNWLDRNPSGRLLNRMSDDQAKVDCALPFAFGSVFATGFSLAGDLLAVMGITRYLVIVMIPIGYIYSRLTAIYLRCSRDIQRLMSLSQSPILTYISEISDGLVVVRAMGSKAIEFVTVRNQNLVDENCRMAHLVMASSCWFTLRIQVTGTIILFFIIIISFSCKSFISPGLLGLSISYGLSLSNSLQSLIFNVAWFENSMICPERIVEYINIPQEGTPSQKSLFLEDAAEDVVDMSKGIKNNINNVEKIDRESQSSSSWSPHGSIRYDQVRFRYQPGGELVLKNVSFNIPAGSKVGVVGRTGSGKSSLIMSLFRIAELSGGAIYIDGINIQIIQLKVLRSNIEIIPQNPVLFKGRLRLCLDPLQRFSDHDIWNAMKKSSLDTVLFNTDSNREGGSKVRFVSNYLEYELAENGGNLSVGERQMVVLTRAILNGAKILVMDEATASIDHEMDRRIQNILRQAFQGSTVITIAHRIDTIINYDNVLVMRDGEVAQFGSPLELLQYRQGIFYELAKDGLGSSAVESIISSGYIP